jgi:DNA-binding transcriptional regulator YiaG
MGRLAMKTPATWRYRGDKDKDPLHYTDCGLDDIYLVSGYEIEDTPHGEGLSIKDLDKLHEAIGVHLASQKKALSGKELRFLRLQMNLTQSELGRFCGLSSQQVARWEKGENEISGPAELLVRGLYIQHVGKKLDIQKLVKTLDELDAPINDKSYFENTSQGWKARKAA